MNNSRIVEYLEKVREKEKEALNEIREAVLELVPEAEEGFC